MSIESFENRDAANPAALAEAVLCWVATGGDEADMALEAVLLEEGVICPEDAIESIESGADGIVITLDNMDASAINAVTGAVAKLAE